MDSAKKEQSNFVTREKGAFVFGIQNISQSPNELASYVYMWVHNTTLAVFEFSSQSPTSNVHPRK
jgi:hypothetical protein